MSHQSVRGWLDKAIFATFDGEVLEVFTASAHVNANSERFHLATIHDLQLGPVRGLVGAFGGQATWLHLQMNNGWKHVSPVHQSCLTFAQSLVEAVRAARASAH